MSNAFFEEQEFKGKDYHSEPLQKGDYEYCTFSECNFSNADLSHITFVECTFDGCDLSNANLNRTSFKDVTFKNCKLMGLRFEHCNPFLMAMQFENCKLQFSSFYDLSLKNTAFKNCDLQEADFTQTDFTGATFDDCDLGLATFENTTLEKADLRSAYNFSIDPELNKITKARFSTTGLAGLLGRYDIDVD